MEDRGVDSIANVWKKVLDHLRKWCPCQMIRNKNEINK